MDQCEQDLHNFTVRAVILAGALNDGPLAEVSDVQYEAQIPLGDKTLLQHVLQACRKARYIDEITVVGFAVFEEDLSGSREKLAPAGETFIESLQNGLQGSGEADFLLFCTADAPLISGEALDDFVERCLQVDAEFCACALKRQTVEERFGQVQRTWARLREGKITLGSCFFGSVAAVKRVMPAFRRLYRVRKNVVRMAWILGPAFILKFAVGLASLRDIENLFDRMLQVQGKAVLSPYAEMAQDIDKPQDLQMARRWMNN